MSIITPISIGTILIIGIILGSPLIALGIKLPEVFQLISQYVFEITLGCFALSLIIALIYFIVTQDIIYSFPIFCNLPAVGIIPVFSIASIASGFTQVVIWVAFLLA